MLTISYQKLTRLFVLFALLLLSACATTDRKGPTHGTVTATLLTAGYGAQLNGRAAVPGQSIRSGNWITTGTNASALVRFSDRTTLQIIDAIDPVYIQWSGERLVLRMDDGAVEVKEKGFLIRIIEAIGQLAHSFHESQFVVEEKRTRFFRVDLFAGRAQLKRPRDPRALAPGQYFQVSRDGRVDFGRTSSNRLRELRSRFDRWKFPRTAPVRPPKATKRIWVPNLHKLSYDQARKKLEHAGLRVGQIKGPISSESYVVGQYPNSNQQVTKNSRVDLTLKVRTVLVPDVQKLTYNRARKKIEKAGLRVGKIKGPTSSNSYVVRQYPPSNRHVPTNSRVDLDLEIPIPMVRVPNVVNKRLHEAIAELKRYGLTYRIYGDQIGDAVNVVKQSPTSSSRVPRGSQVRLWVQGILY